MKGAWPSTVILLLTLGANARAQAPGQGPGPGPGPGQGQDPLAPHGFPQRPRPRPEVEEHSRHQPAVLPFLVLDLPDARALLAFGQGPPVAAVGVAGRELARVGELELGNEARGGVGHSRDCTLRPR